MFFTGGFPFGDDFGGPSASERAPKREVDNTKFYNLLGLDSSASSAEIKKAYRKLAIQHHPDKGGDPDTFKDLSRAYEILSDPEKRNLYDQYGESGLDGGGGAEPQDIFDLFFGGGGRRRGPPQKVKGQDITSHLKIPLEQLYKGATRKLAVNRDVLCAVCDGHGGPKNAIETCSSCDGQGIRVEIRRMGQMIQQMQSRCQVCNGEGSRIPPNKVCKECKGNKIVKERKVLEVYVEPGAPHSHKCVFRGEADQKPGEEPGDVVFVLDQQDHPIFKRKGVDLFVEKEITLIEALGGFRFIIDSLDDRKLLIKNHPGEIIKPGDLRCIRAEGMPTHKNPFVKGDLFISFSVQFPSPHSLDPSALEIIAKILPPADDKEIIDENSQELEHHFIENYSPQERQNNRSGEAYDEDDDERHMGGSGQRVQCRQQ